MRTKTAFFIICYFLGGLTPNIFASYYDILRPAVPHHHGDAKKISSMDRKRWVAEHRAEHNNDGLNGSLGLIDTVTWRSKRESDVNFGFLNPGDSLLLWLEPAAACSLIAVRFRSINWEGSTLHDIWNAGRYDPKISSAESVDAYGWIGTFEPITDPGGWISGLWDHSPLGGSALEPNHHYWGPFPYTVTAAHANVWVEIPAAAGLQGEVDLGSDPFFIGSVFYITSGWGFHAEYPWRTPYTFFKFYSAGTGPDDVHNGWFIRSYFMWFEAVVKYYENTPPKFSDLKVQNFTYSSGPFPITVTLRDKDSEDETKAGVASAELVYDINGIINRTSMEGPPEGGLFTADIPELTEGDVATYWIEATDFHEASSQSRKVTFARLEPEHPTADILIIWDDLREEDLDTFFVDLFSTLETQFDFELWNVSKRNGIDASVINWGWRTIYVSGWGCEKTLPGRDYADNPFVEWLENGTTEKPHHLLYIDQDYFCAHPEYDCDWEGRLTRGDFIHDYFGLSKAISDNRGAADGGYDSQAIGLGDFSGIHVNFYPNAWDPTYPESDLWPDWIVNVTEDAEYIFKYADPPIGSGFGAGVRLDRGTYKTVYLPWQDYFAVSSTENGDLVPRPHLIETFNRIFEWFEAPGSDANSTEGPDGIPQHHFLTQNHPNPFNMETEISFGISGTAEVTLFVYNVLGHIIEVLVENEFMEAGFYNMKWNAQNLASGIYFYRLRAGEFTETKRMLLLK